MLKVAYFCEPQVGGTFSFYKRMRPHLLRLGIDFRCISPFSGEHLAGSRFEDEDGIEDVRFPDGDRSAASEILIRHLVEHRFDVVIVLPGSDIIATNLVRYLPRQIRTAARVPMITRGAYAPTKAIDSSLDLVFAVSHRVQDDLTRRYGVSPDKIRTIYNGVEVQDSFPRRTYGQGGKAFQLLYSGRLSDVDKGVLLLPGILQRVCAEGVNAHLTLVGTGPDGNRLESEFRRLRLLDRVTLAGNVALGKVGELLADTDCFLLPSRFEGCPNALLEAMAAGCACVASRIRGSVDQIVEDGQSGMLVSVAEVNAFARKVVLLARDPRRCQEMGEQARQRISRCYTADLTAAAYAKTLKELLTMPDGRSSALSLSGYEVPRVMEPTWRTSIPSPIKNYARKWMERFGISS